MEGASTAHQEASALLQSHDLTRGCELLDGRPEFVTPLPEAGEGRNHDLWLRAGSPAGPVTICIRIAEQHRPQLTTDGLEGYINAVEEHFGADGDFAQLVKNYAQPRTDGPDWFRPSSHVVSTTAVPLMGDPDPARISTSHIERANLTVRMHLHTFRTCAAPAYNPQSAIQPPAIPCLAGDRDSAHFVWEERM